MEGLREIPTAVGYVIEAKHRMTEAEHAQTHENFRIFVDGTPLQGKPLLILDDGMAIRAIGYPVDEVKEE